MDGLDNLTLTHYGRFIALAEEKTFAKAAKRLHVTSSALSQTIKFIEGELHATLIIRRDKTGAPLTPDGERFLEQAHLMVAAAKGVVQTLRTADMGGGILRVGHAASARELAVRAAAKLLHDLPDLRITLEELPSKRITSRLRDKRLDLGLVRDWETKNSFEAECVAKAPLRLVVNAGHPRLAKVNRIGALRDLAGERFVLTTPHEAARTTVEEYFAKNGLALPRVVMETNTMANAMRLIRLRPEIVTMLAVPGPHLDNVPGLQMVNLPNPPEHSTFLVWRSPEIRTAAAKRFAEALREHLETSPVRPTSNKRGR